jgi:hypothetical protein
VSRGLTVVLCGASGRISVERTPRGRMGGGTGCGIRRGTKGSRTIAKAFFIFIFILAYLLAMVFSAKLVAVIVAIIARKFVAAKIRCACGAGFAGRSAEIGENGLLPNLTLAQGGEVVGYSLLFVESDLARVGAHETLVEDSAGKLVKVFLFEGTQHAGADFGRVGDGVERDSALLALLAKFFSERSHEWLRRAKISVRVNRD